MKGFVGMETSGQMRRRLAAKGYDVISCDLLPADDGCVTIPVSEIDQTQNMLHIQGDVYEVLDDLWAKGWWPDFAIFHPTCTYLTGSAEWAYADPDFDRYPGVGYHQRVKTGTLTGAARRRERELEIENFRRLVHLPIRVKIFENPVGVLSSRVAKPNIVVQPYQCGDDASKKTCFWVFDKQNVQMKDFPFRIDPAKYVPPTLRANGKSYWANQTDSGQNRLSPGADRWKDRSETFDGIGDFVVDAIQEHYGI